MITLVSRFCLVDEFVSHGDGTDLWHTVDVLCDQALVSPPMIPLEMDRELGVDSQRRLYADNYITGLVGDP